MRERFLVFCLPRTGSNTLMGVLNCHPDVRCCHEPFSTTRRDIPVHDPIVETREMLDARLERLWAEYDGIKHVFIPSGWPFPLKSTLNRDLLLRPGHRVILLHRKNLLQQFVSNEMAIQSRVFQAERSVYRSRIGEFRFRPIEDRRLGRRLRRWRDEIEWCRRELSRSGKPTLELTYEELFAPAVSVEEKWNILDRIFGFLDRDPGAEGLDRPRIAGLIDPDRSKINSAETYRLVPGIQEIERRFGDTYGSLFR